MTDSDNWKGILFQFSFIFMEFVGDYILWILKNAEEHLVKYSSVISIDKKPN